MKMFFNIYVIQRECSIIYELEYIYYYYKEEK